MPALVIGVDAGASSTRAVVLGADGTVRGRGTAGGANRNSSGSDLTETLVAAVRPALTGVGDPAAIEIAGAVIGMAGAGAAAGGHAAVAAERAWQVLGMSPAPAVVEDVLVAYAAGSGDPDGLVLVAGTGAIAAAVRGWRLDDRRDGLGWILGDEGSAVWLGVRAARAAVRATDGRGPATVLADRVGEAMGAGPAPASSGRGPDHGRVAPADRSGWEQAMVRGGFARPPAALGRLARAVTAAADEGDKVAAGLVDEAADRLTATVTALAPTAAPPVVVLAGALLTPDCPVGRAVHARLAERWPGTPQRQAGPGEVGAAVLALTRLGRPAPPGAAGAPWPR